jgi:hypothetical protein
MNGEALIPTKNAKLVPQLRVGQNAKILNPLDKEHRRT